MHNLHSPTGDQNAPGYNGKDGSETAMLWGQYLSITRNAPIDPTFPVWTGELTLVPIMHGLQFLVFR